MFLAKLRFFQGLSLKRLSCFHLLRQGRKTAWFCVCCVVFQIMDDSSDPGLEAEAICPDHIQSRDLPSMHKSLGRGAKRKVVW